MAQTVRLHLDQLLAPGQPLRPDAAQAHYLFAVMRLGAGARIVVFNGCNGEFEAIVEEAGKRSALVRCGARLRWPSPLPDLWLLFAPLKKTRTDFLVEKAVELGVARLVPVQTDFTNAERIRQDRLQAHAIEAAEQCGGIAVPEVAPMMPLGKALDSWPESRNLLWCNEALAGPASNLTSLPEGASAILIGPEGGFSPAESARLSALPFATPVSLGPRILRAETAAIAALTLWQAARGDWQ